MEKFGKSQKFAAVREVFASLMSSIKALKASKKKKMTAREEEIFNNHKNPPKPKFSAREKEQLAKLSGYPKKNFVMHVKEHYERV